MRTAGFHQRSLKLLQTLCCIYIISNSAGETEICQVSCSINTHLKFLVVMDGKMNIFPTLPLIIVFLSLLNMLLWHHNRQCRQGKQHRGAPDTVWSKK